MYKKYVTIGIAVLIIILSSSQVISFADSQSLKEPKLELLNVEVVEYKADGSIEEREVLLSKSECKDFKIKLLYADTIEKKFSLYQEYGIISREISYDIWEVGMQQKADSLSLTEDTIKIRTRIRAPILLSFFNKVDVVCFLGTSLRVGLTPIVNWINIKGIDIIDACWGFFGLLSTDGLFSSHSIVAMPLFVAVIGFVGVTLKIPFTVQIVSGFSAVTAAFGLGLHTVDYGLFN
jgi:hypothetical protein